MTESVKTICAANRIEDLLIQKGVYSEGTGEIFLHHRAVHQRIGCAIGVGVVVDAYDGQIGITDLEDLVECRRANHFDSKGRLRKNETKGTGDGAGQKRDAETVSPRLEGGGLPVSIITLLA